MLVNDDNYKDILFNIVREFRFMPIDLVYELMYFIDSNIVDELVDYEVKGSRIFALDDRKHLTKALGTYRYLVSSDIDFSPTKYSTRDRDMRVKRYSLASAAGYFMSQWDIRDLYFKVPRRDCSVVDLWFLEDKVHNPDEPYKPDFYSVCVLDTGRGGSDTGWYSRAMAYGKVKQDDCMLQEDGTAFVRPCADIALLTRRPEVIDAANAKRRKSAQFPPTLEFLKNQGFSHAVYPNLDKDGCTLFEAMRELEVKKLEDPHDGEE